MEEAKYRIVLRGHETRDIQGVSQVVGRETLNALSFVKDALGKHPCEIVVISDNYTEQDVRDERACTDNTIYIGGTGQLWAMLNPRVRFDYCDDGGKQSRYRVKMGAQRIYVFPTPYYIDFLIYRKVLTSGREIVAVFGPTPIGTTWAAHHLRENYSLLECYKEVIAVYQAPLRLDDAQAIFKSFRGGKELDKK